MILKPTWKLKFKHTVVLRKKCEIDIVNVKAFKFSYVSINYSSSNENDITKRNLKEM